MGAPLPADSLREWQNNVAPRFRWTSSWGIPRAEGDQWPGGAHLLARERAAPDHPACVILENRLRSPISRLACSVHNRSPRIWTLLKEILSVRNCELFWEFWFGCHENAMPRRGMREQE